MELSTGAKIAAIPTAAVALLAAKYVIGHALTVMIIVAVIAGMIAVLQSAKAKRAEVRQAEQGQEQVQERLAQIRQHALPQAQAAQREQEQERIVSQALRQRVN